MKKTFWMYVIRKEVSRSVPKVIAPSNSKGGLSTKGDFREPPPRRGMCASHPLRASRPCSPLACVKENKSFFIKFENFPRCKRERFIKVRTFTHDVIFLCQIFRALLDVWLSWQHQPQDGDISNHLTCFYHGTLHIYIYIYIYIYFPINLYLYQYKVYIYLVCSRSNPI